MPPIWLTGISHSLNSAASWSSARRRMRSSRLILSWSESPVGIDGRELHKEFLLSLASHSLTGLHGVVGDLVVVALVADGGGEFRLPLEIFFPVIMEEAVQRFGAIFRRGGRFAVGASCARRKTGAKSNAARAQAASRFKWAGPSAEIGKRGIGMSVEHGGSVASSGEMCDRTISGKRENRRRACGREWSG